MMLFLLLCFFTAASLEATSVYKRVLGNGLTVLVRPTQSTQKVSTQLWINVGSKHEQDNEKGLAHWLEHMFFKGTQRMSETDIYATATKLSGSKNATTSYDWTRFYIDLPVQHWYEALPILADGMCNCTFQQDLMNSEVQVVIQELKMGKDRPGVSLAHTMYSALFHDHPYHYPVIGYKSDLKNLTRDQLVRFYKKYYVPSNAAVVIVGNVVPERAFELAEQSFGSIPFQEKPTLPKFTHQQDTIQHSSTVYRPIQYSVAKMSYIIPGEREIEPFVTDVIMHLLTQSSKAILAKRLIDDLQLVNWVDVDISGLFDYGVFTVSFELKDRNDSEKIMTIIQQEIDTLAQGKINQEHCSSVIKKAHMNHGLFLENNHSQATAIAETYLARNDENFFFDHYLMHDQEDICQKVQQFCATYLRAHAMHTGYILPLPAEEQETWNTLQEQSNAEDAQILANKQRQSAVEEPRYAHTVQPQKPADFTIPVPNIMDCDNGLTVYYYHNPTINSIEFSLNFKVNHWYQADDQCGILYILAGMLAQGTEKYSQEELNDILSKHCINLQTNDSAIYMKMLQEDFPKAFELLEEIALRPALKKEAFEKIKNLVLADIQRAHEDIFSLAQRYFYGNHPYGTKFAKSEHVAALTQEDLSAFHKQYFSPDGALLVIVGNLENYNIPELVNATVARWEKKTVPDIDWPAIVANTHSPTSHFLDREQVALGLAAQSISRTHPDYYKLLLFDMVFYEKLFSLRSLTGAFYSIDGSVLFRSQDQPGLAQVIVNVSQTRVAEVEALLRDKIPQIVASFNEHDLATAKLGLANSLSEYYSTNHAIMDQFIGLHQRKLPFDYYAQRNALVENISVSDVQEAVARILDPAKLVTFKVGRVETK